MQNEIIAKIDSLVKMSESTANAGTLNVELRDIEVQIKEKKLDLKEIKSSITDDKYFDATSEIVDKNIEISLNKKIKYLNKSLLELTSKVSEVSKDEESKYAELERLKKSIEDSKEFITILNTKIESANKEEKEYFEKLLEETEENLKENKKELSKLTKLYEKIQGKLEALSFSKSEIEKKLEEDTEKLIDVKSNLLNKRGYVNNELKQEDQEKIENLENQIKELEKQKTEILKDPVMIAEEAKNYLIDDDKTGALKKIKELKEIIEQQPYMDINLNTDGKSLNVELENIEAKRDEIVSMINSKNYESVDTTLIKDRIDYIKDKKVRLEKEIDEINEKIKQYDESILEDLNNRINYCENEAKNLKNKIKEYEETLKDENLTPNKKASLQASFNKKQEEYENVEKLLDDYKNDRKITILTSYNLQTKDIASIQDEIEKIDQEIKKLEKLSVSSNKAKDLIAMENDKKTLKDLNDTIKAIKKRQEIKTSPSEMYDEIEILLGTDYVEEQSYNTSDVIDGIDDFITQTDETTNSDDIPEVEIESMYNGLETQEIEQSENANDEMNLNEQKSMELPNVNSLVFEDIKPLDNINNDEEQNDNLQVLEEMPILELENNSNDTSDVTEEEKLKVIDIEPLESNTETATTESLENNEFLIGDYNSEG